MSAPQQEPAEPAVIHTNQLGNESSPYLRQHAANPVNWYAWGPEAFEAARRENKPIFLSVGYSTCYWCHVMERESFEIQATADVMNEHFINIKVDREERPDVDEIYMTAVQALTGRGGWPMSVFLEPETLKPFFGGTYFPPQDQGDQPGFISVLTQIADHWKNDRPRVDRTANAVALDVQKRLSLQQAPAETGQQQIDQAVTTYLSRYDRTHAGFLRRAGGPSSQCP